MSTSCRPSSRFAYVPAMPSHTAPLSGLRIIEVSMLGPGRPHHPPRRPRRRRHQGRAAAGRLRPAHDLADRRGRLAVVPPHQPGQAQHRARPPHRRRAAETFRSPRSGSRRGRRGHAPGRPRAARPRVSSSCKEVNPKIVFATISGYGMTGPYRDMPSHGIAYDVWAGLVSPATDDDGFPYMPEHPSVGITRRSVVRCARLARRCAARARDRRGLSSRDRAVGCRGRDGLAAQRDVEGVRATRVRGDRERGRQLSNGARQERRAWRTVFAISSTRRTTATCCSWLPSASSGRTSAPASDRLDLFERWPGSQYGDHARGNTELRAILRDIFATRSSAEWLAFGLEHNTPIAPANTPKTLLDDPAVPEPVPAAARRAGRRRHVADADQVHRRGAPDAFNGADRRRAHRGRASQRARLGRQPDRGGTRGRRIRVAGPGSRRVKSTGWKRSEKKKRRWERWGRAAIPSVPLPVLQGVRARRAGGGAPDPDGTVPLIGAEQHAAEREIELSPSRVTFAPPSTVGVAKSSPTGYPDTMSGETVDTVPSCRWTGTARRRPTGCSR